MGGSGGIRGDVSVADYYANSYFLYTISQLRPNYPPLSLHIPTVDASSNGHDRPFRRPTGRRASEA